MIYFDNAATTKVDNEVIDAMIPFFNQFYANPSSQHRCGKIAFDALDQARFDLCLILNCTPNEIIFTSGATESNNLAIKGCLDQMNCAASDEGPFHFIFSEIEHKSVLSLKGWLESKGHEVDLIPTLPSGIIDIDVVEPLIKDNTFILSCIHVNNETGVIQPIEKLAEICAEHNIIFHVDATQSFTKLKIDLAKIPIDLLSFSAHKFFAAKGVGGLYKNNAIKLKCQAQGGSQEEGFRPGTENIPGIIGMAKAAKINYKNINNNFDYLENLGEYFEEALKASDESFIINGLGNKVPWIYNVTFLKFKANYLFDNMQEFCFSKSSACSRGIIPSYVLTAMHVDEELIENTIRLSFSKYNTKEEIDLFFVALKKLSVKLK